VSNDFYRKPPYIPGFAQILNGRFPGGSQVGLLLEQSLASFAQVALGYAPRHGTTHSPTSADPLDDNSITDGKLRDSAATSVIGRSATTAGDPADIVAGTNSVLGRTSGVLGFSQLATGQVADAAVTYAKIQDVSAASRLLGRGSAAGAGDVEELTLAPGLSLLATILTMLPVVLRPAQVTGNQNDWNPGTKGSDRTTLFVSTDASRNFTGLLATGVADGAQVTWINDGAQNEVLQHLNAGSAAANQFRCNTGADVTIPAAGAAMLLRDSTAAVWRVFAL
jgi:hypothetical protein